jgi:hypothetical protein
VGDCLMGETHGRVRNSSRNVWSRRAHKAFRSWKCRIMSSAARPKLNASTVNRFGAPRDQRALQTPIAASRDRHQCVLLKRHQCVLLKQCAQVCARFTLV